MFKTLSPGAIGLTARGLTDGLALAQRGGFEGLEFSVAEVADLIDAQGAAAVQQLFTAAGIRPAGWGLPVDWRTTEENWRRDLDKLPRLARASAALGCRRTATYILSWSDTLPYADNRQFHITRFRPIAQILGEHGISLGLEFLGPQTLYAGKAHPFIHTLPDMLAMAREIGPNVGLLLDAWHWFTAHHTVADLTALRASDVVYVHVNDAPRGLAIDAQVDNVRCLPGETGVIDIAGFLQALRRIGYDGPIVPEPFKKELAALPDDAARVRLVGEAMATIFTRAGL